jgi:hypothetical protein
LNPQSLNSYSYSSDNPITKSDPSGKDYLEFNASADVEPASLNLGVRVDLRNLRMDVSYGGGVATGISAVSTVFYSPDNLPKDKSYLTQNIDATAAYFIAGKTSITNTQSLEGGKQFNLSGGPSFGLGVGMGLSASANINHYSTIIDYSKSYNLLKQISSDLARIATSLQKLNTTANQSIPVVSNINNASNRTNSGTMNSVNGSKKSAK